MMDAVDLLKALLQVQLASDETAIENVGYALTMLSPQCFCPPPHLQQWILRVNSLLHSKISGARWAGLCVAHETSSLSKSVMIHSSQDWLGLTLPLLSVCACPTALP